MNWLIKLIGIDKLKHIAVCLLIAAAVGIFLSLLGADFGVAAVAAAASAESAAVTKEWCDDTYGGKWDWKDFLADQVGIVLAVAWLVMFHFSKG